MSKQKNFSVFLVLGPPGSGKGTQIKLLAEKLGFFHFIASFLGKEYIKTHNDSESLKQKERYEKGLLFEPEWIFEILKEKTKEIYEDKNCKGIIYDGSPRTLYEAQKLYEFLNDLVGKENIKIIEIDVKEEELKRRLARRVICSKNAAHTFIGGENLKPGDPCPKNDGILGKRDLDKEEIFLVRMDEYKNQTMPGLEYLKKLHLIITINGEQDIEDVHKEIMGKL